MPYQPTNPYPYNTGIDLREGLTFQFRVDNYDTIIKFEIEIYDLFKNERIYTIVREIGGIEINSIGEKTLIEGNDQIIRIFDDTNTLIYFDKYEYESVLPVKGGLSEESVCKIELTNYLKTIVQIKNEQYYGNVEDFANFKITEIDDPDMQNESYYILNGDMYIIDINENYKTFFQEEVTRLIIPYEVQGNIVKGIGDNVFENLVNLQEVIIPSSIYEVGNNTFKGCSSLNSVVFNYGLSKIGNSAFEGCSNLSFVELLDTITTIGNSCFKDCINLTEIKLSSSITTIPESCFEGDVLLTNINFKKIENIQSSAFEGCVSLYEVNLPDTLKTVAYGAFSGCGNIVKMILPFVGENKDATGKNGLFGYIFGEIEGGVLQKYSETEEGYFDIPLNLAQIEITEEEVIPYGAFYNCKELISLILNEGITEIGDYAFFNCKYLKDIELPNTVSIIGKGAFGLEEVTE